MGYRGANRDRKGANRDQTGGNRDRKPTTEQRKKYAFVLFCVFVRLRQECGWRVGVILVCFGWLVGCKKNVFFLFEGVDEMVGGVETGTEKKEKTQDKIYCVILH